MRLLQRSQRAMLGPMSGTENSSRNLVGGGLIGLLLVLAGCAPHPRCEDLDALNEEAPILIIGDSVFDYHQDECGDVGDFMSLSLEAKVADRAIAGLQMHAEDGDDIMSRYSADDWTWVVVDGGANDLNNRCGCECDTEVDELIGEDSTSGHFVSLTEQAVSDGAQVVVFGYYNPMPGSEFEPCIDEVEVLNSRLAALADGHESITFVDGREVMSPNGSPVAYHEDGIHPSTRGAEMIAEAILQAMEGS
jgi:hypothetical protein